MTSVPHSMGNLEIEVIAFLDCKSGATHNINVFMFNFLLGFIVNV